MSEEAEGIENMAEEQPPTKISSLAQKISDPDGAPKPKKNLKALFKKAALKQVNAVAFVSSVKAATKNQMLVHGVANRNRRSVRQRKASNSEVVQFGINGDDATDNSAFNHSVRQQSDVLNGMKGQLNLYKPKRPALVFKQSATKVMAVTRLNPVRHVCMMPRSRRSKKTRVAPVLKLLDGCAFERRETDVMQIKVTKVGSEISLLGPKRVVSAANPATVLPWYDSAAAGGLWRDSSSGSLYPHSVLDPAVNTSNVISTTRPSSAHTGNRPSASVSGSASARTEYRRQRPGTASSSCSRPNTAGSVRSLHSVSSYRSVRSTDSSTAPLVAVNATSAPKWHQTIDFHTPALPAIQLDPSKRTKLSRGRQKAMSNQSLHFGFQDEWQERVSDTVNKIRVRRKWQSTAAPTNSAPRTLPNQTFSSRTW